MNYQRLKLGLEKYGRDCNFAYVCSTYKPELKRDKKYQQWQRLLHKVGIKSLSSTEKQVLNSMLEIRVAHAVWVLGSGFKGEEIN